MPRAGRPRGIVPARTAGGQGGGGGTGALAAGCFSFARPARRGRMPLVPPTTSPFQERAMKKATFAAAVGIALLLGLAAVGLRPGEAQAPKQERPARWEYKAVQFTGIDPDNHAHLLNGLAGDGWEYVGPLNTRADGRISTTSVAFKRPKK